MTKITHNEKGFASLVIALTIIIVLSLIAVGFATLMRREQRQALDKQLKSQAFYAAESGINDALQAMSKGTLTKDKTSCPPDASLGLPSNNVDTTGLIQYSCLLVNMSPPYLQYGSITEDTTTATTFTGVDSAGNPQNIARIEVSWQNDQSSPGAFPSFGGSPSFPTAAGWTSTTGVMRVALTPVDNNNLSRTKLQQDTYTAFLYPHNNGSIGTKGNATYTNNQTQTGQIVNGECNASSLPLWCTTSINTSSANSNQFLIQLRSIYRPSQVIIKVYSASSVQLNTQGAQAIIDSTGKANDILHRLQVRVPLAKSDLGGFALETGDDICKQLTLYPGSPNPSPICPIN